LHAVNEEPCDKYSRREAECFAQDPWEKYWSNGILHDAKAGRPDHQTDNQGFGSGGLFTTCVGTCVTWYFGAGFFLGFLISRLPLSLFPMTQSLPQVDKDG
jgi:hypothetical protein